MSETAAVFIGRNADAAQYPSARCLFTINLVSSPIQLHLKVFYDDNK